MCTLTFLPDQQSGFYLTANRDESIKRKKALPPKAYRIGNTWVYFPLDLKAGGTWYAAGENGYACCLMNGAFEPHQSEPPYRHSRGKVILDFFHYSAVEDFAVDYSFEGIEPFTLLIFESGKNVVIHNCRWDGIKLHKESGKENGPGIWSSASLYRPEIRNKREDLFREWLENRETWNREDIMDFHLWKNEKDKDKSLLIDIPGKVKTISVTSVHFDHGGNREMVYYDTLARRKYRIRF